MKLSFKKLNAIGASHIVALMLVIVGVGIAGTLAVLLSHADTIHVDCPPSGASRTTTYHGTTVYNCGFYTTAQVISTTSGTRLAGTIHAGTNWVYCQQQTRTVFHLGSYYNNWWAYTLSDNGGYGWVNGVYGKGGSSNATYGSSVGQFSNVPSCNGSRGTPPASTGPFSSSTQPVGCVSARTVTNGYYDCSGNLHCNAGYVRAYIGSSLGCESAQYSCTSLGKYWEDGGCYVHKDYTTCSHSSGGILYANGYWLKDVCYGGKPIGN